MAGRFALRAPREAAAIFFRPRKFAPARAGARVINVSNCPRRRLWCRGYILRPAGSYYCEKIYATRPRALLLLRPRCSVPRFWCWGPTRIFLFLFFFTPECLQCRADGNLFSPMLTIIRGWRWYGVRTQQNRSIYTLHDKRVWNVFI